MRDLCPSELLYLISSAITHVQEGRWAMLKDTCQISTRDLSDIGDDLIIFPGVVHYTQERVLARGCILEEVEVEAS